VNGVISKQVLACQKRKFIPVNWTFLFSKVLQPCKNNSSHSARGHPSLLCLQFFGKYQGLEILRYLKHTPRSWIFRVKPDMEFTLKWLCLCAKVLNPPYCFCMRTFPRYTMVCWFESDRGNCSILPYKIMNIAWVFGLEGRFGYKNDVSMKIVV